MTSTTRVPDEDDAPSLGLLDGRLLDACPARPDATSAAFLPPASRLWEDAAGLLAAGRAVSSGGGATRVEAFVGDRLERGSAAFDLPPAIRAAAKLDAWLATSAAARSAATCPAAVLLEAAAVAPAMRRVCAVSNALVARLRGEWGLRETLSSLRAAYLGGAGEAAHAFASAVFGRLDRFGPAPPRQVAGGGDEDEGDERGDIYVAWSDPSELNAALAEALAADESGELPDPREIFVETTRGRDNTSPPGTPGRASASSQVRAGGDGDEGEERQTEGKTGGLREGKAQLEALATLRLSVRVPWPLTLVIPERCLERYNAAWVFLLQVRRARAALDEVVKAGWSGAARRVPGGGGGGPHARRLATELRHFVAALHEHIISRVLHSAWRDLVVAIERADSIRAARDAHAAFLDATARQCLVSPDQTWTLLAGQVKAALAIACDFAAAQRRSAATAKDSASDADPSVGMRLVGPPAASTAAAARQAAALQGYAPVPEDEAERLAAAFRRARSYVLRVIESKLKLGAFPELAELRLRLDFNGFYGVS